MHRFNHVPCGFIRLNKDGSIIYVNETMLDWLKFSKAELENKHFEKILPNVSKTIIYSYFYPTIFIKGKVNELVLKIYDVKGEPHSYILNARRFEHPDGNYVDCAFIQMDKRMHYEEELKRVRLLTEQALKEKEEALATLEKLHTEIELKQQQLLEINEELKRKSTIDHLTGVYNRAYFSEFIKGKLGLYEEKNEGFSIILADIDHFKKVNDFYGHLIGDVVLAQVAKILKTSIQKDGIVTRFGGEEFVVVLPRVSREESKKIARSLNETIAKYDFDEIHHVTVSLGIATVQNSDTISTILKRADDALYYVKENGRNQACHYNDL